MDADPKLVEDDPSTETASEFWDEDDERPAAPVNDQIAALEMKVAKLEDRLREYRFHGFLAIVFAFDCYFFPTVSSTAAILCIFALEVVGLTIAAKRCGVEEVSMLVDKVSGWFKKSS
ncbi:MAG: hypothetical protein R3C03_24150 [Pirellulaceae bacterium]